MVYDKVFIDHFMIYRSINAIEIETVYQGTILGKPTSKSESESE